MRFPQVAIGQRFTFQGRQYTKTGPLTASEEHTGKQRLLARSAEVTLIDGAGQAVKEIKQRYNRAEMVRLLANFKAELVESLCEAAAEDGTLPLDQVVSLIESREFR
ncbi:MAG: polysulfide reductase chain A [Candidatus Thiodiazotropha sp.]